MMMNSITSYRSRLLVFLFIIHMLEAIVSCFDVAVIEIVLYENNDGDYTTYTYQVQGRFSRAGATTSAEGHILQLHGQNLCSATSDTSKQYEYGWVGILKIPPPQYKKIPCLSVVGKAKVAMQRGATAVIFDISDNPAALSELEEKEDSIFRPVILIQGREAKKLGNLLEKHKLSRARIQYKVRKYRQEQKTTNEYFDMGIFMAFFVLVSLVCLILLIKIKWKQKRKQTSITRMALQAISRMETRKYSRSFSFGSQQSLNTVYSCNRWPSYDIKSCAICLEEFMEGQDIRIVPCRHEFHKSCVDPWLLSNCTCPLCMLNIVEPLSRKKKRQRRLNGSRSGSRARSRARQFFRYLLPNQWTSTNNDTTSDTPANTNIDHFASLERTLPDTLYPDFGLPYSWRPSSLSLSSGLAHAQMPSNTATYLPTDCIPPHRFHKCKFHHKKNRLRASMAPSLGTLGRDFEHSIVVVANLPMDNFDDLQEDVV